MEFRIRNSMLNDWEEMCHLAFRARWFGTPEEQKLMDISNLPAIRWGSYFEQLVLGSGVGGKLIELTDKELRSDLYPRVKRQAETARGFIFGTLKEMGYPFLKAQVTLETTFVIDGMNVDYQGNADALLGVDIPELILDTKYTGDTTNTFGKYAWGKPETMDMGQLVGYTEAAGQIYGKKPKAMYYVADSTPKERVEPIEVEFTNEYIQMYMWRLKEAYVEIRQALAFNYWSHKSSYNNCKNCPLNKICDKAVLVPEIKTIMK